MVEHRRVPHIHIILLVNLNTATVLVLWVEKRDIFGSEVPNSKCTAEGSNAGVRAFDTLHKHAIGRELLSPGDMPQPRCQRRKHEMVRKLRLVVEAANLTAILGKSLNPVWSLG